MAQRGGKRPGAGRKPGSKNKLTKATKASITELAMSHAATAIETLVGIMQSELAPAAARVSAANAVLDRAVGKAMTVDDGGDGEAPALTITVTPKAPVGDVRVTRATG